MKKSYENGYEEYAFDLINRYNNGELTSSDSIEFPESQRFKTLSLNRTVYGGGGIMPDYFVPMDTSSYSNYYRQLINMGIFNRFVLQYVDDHRNELLREYPDFNFFNTNFEPSLEQLTELVAYAGEEKLEYNEKEWNISKDRISLLFKGYVARDLFGTGNFYEVFNPTNEVFNKAVEILDNPLLHQRKLAKVE